MSGPNHVIGGTVFTGIYLSMWDINIFSQPLFLFFTAICSVIPDIDHTKSIIGKVFYPIAKFIDKRYGHRTITHSILFYLSTAIIIGIIERIIISGSGIYSAIFLWAYGSHLILDMMTKQGIPLFYPFKKNPCVIPGNPDFRFRASDRKTEAIIFLVFILFGYSCRNLFVNGFWNTYNKTFSNIKHVQNEIKLSEKIVLVDYEFERLGNKYKGKGYAINSTDEKLLIFDKQFIVIEKADKIKNLNPIRTNQIIQEQHLSFSNITFDSLQKLIQNKPLLSIKLQAALPIQYEKDNKPQSSVSLELEHQYNPVFKSSNIDSVDLSTQKEIELVKLDIARNQQEQTLYNQQRNSIILYLKDVEDNLKSSDLATKEKAIKDYSKAKQEVESLRPPVNQSAALQVRLSFLQSKLHIHKNQSINGFISYFTIK